MRLRQRFFAFVGVITVAFGFAAPTLAQSTTDTVSVTLAGGVVSFSIDVTANISTLAYDHGSGYTNGTGGAFTILVQDDRNTFAGYTINLAASHFTRTDGGTGTINLGVGDTKLAVPTAGTVTRVAGDFANLPTALTATSLTSTAVPILTAASGAGNGHYSAAGYSLSLSGVSSIVPAGNYISTLTLTSPAGPS